LYAIVDIEGNGGAYRKECITEIAIYRFDGHEVVDQFISLVHPEEPITPFVQKLTGITDKMVKTAPKFHELARRVVEITENATLVGHNIKFDYRMIRQSFQKLGYDFIKPTLDTIDLAKKLIPGESSYSLGKLCKSLGIPIADRHRASGDARATVELLKILLSKDKDKEVIQSLKQENQPANIQQKIVKLTEFLPAKSGIVYFQNEEGKIIYRIYAEDINQTAKKMLSSNKKSFRKICTETAQIEFEYTGTPLIAKLILLQTSKAARENLSQGLYYKEGKYIVEKSTKNEEPLLRFKSKLQGLHALKIICENEEFKNHPENLKKFLSMENRNQLWISSGRTKGEKSFIVLQNGKIDAFGFYKFYHQIASLEKINKLKTKIKKADKGIYNELKLSLLLKKNYEIRELPKK